MISSQKQSRSFLFVTLQINAGHHDYLAGISVLHVTWGPQAIMFINIRDYIRRDDRLGGMTG